MTVARFLELFSQYGLGLICAVFFCEYMNLPGFPAGVIMPAVGVLVAQSELNVLVALVLSVAAGLGGSVALYLICRYGGAPLLDHFFGKNEKATRFVRRCQERLERHGARELLFCRLIPVLRTIVSIPAGLLKVPLKEFVLWSAAGIALWNSALILAGYLFSEMLLNG
jgi:membrane protein DedA with SNARE-associated domain